MTSPIIRPTLVALPTEVKEASIPVLNDLLKKFLTLALLTKQAHWNLRGPNFLAAHELLDTVNASFLTNADDIAERVVQLGGIAMGTPEIFTGPTCSCYEPYPTDISSVEDHLNALLKRFAGMSQYLRQITTDDSLQDDVAVAMLQEALANLEKNMWFIEAQLGS